MPALGEWQYALGDFVFGYGTPWVVNAFDAEYPDVRTQDAPVARGDGVTMGMDLHGAMNIAIELEVEGEQEADTLALLSQLRRAFYADGVRRAPGEYVPLSYRTGGSGEQRRVWGRPRKLTPVTLANVHVGHVPCVAQFVCRDGYFYSDTEQRQVQTLIPEQSGGLVGPLIGPLYASGDGQAEGGFTVAGEELAWLATRINGPISVPQVEVVGQFAYALDLTLGPDEWVVVDPQPWQQAVRLGGGGEVSGALTGTSAWLADMRVPPGPHSIVLRGHDPTGTASVEAYWRTVTASL